MFMTRKRGRTAAVFAAVAGLLLTTATTASAITDNPEPTPPAPTIDVDQDGKASITITKLLRPDSTLTEAPGTEVTSLPAGAAPIEGVEFKVERITGFDFDGEDGVGDNEQFDLTTANGWQNAAKLTAEMLNAPGAVVEKESPEADQTAPDGKITFANLKLGLYLVTEVSTDNATIGGELVSESGDAVVPSSKPFLVTVPMTDPVNHDAWMYHVYVYPKNERVGLEKSIEDGDQTVLGDIVTYHVTMDVPKGTTSFIITDELDHRLEYVPDSVEILGHTGMVSYADNVLKVTFTAPEGETLPVATIGFKFKARVVEVGEIENDAIYKLVVNGVAVEGESNDVTTKWGGHDVAKVDENGDYLAGAVFSLYQVRRDGNGQEVVTLIKDGIQSGTDGKVTVDGLRYSLWADGNAISESDARYVFYRLVETKAPTTEDGTTYELQPTPIDFEVTGPADRDGDRNIDLEIVNVPHNAGFELPAIGGNRAVLPIVAAVIAAGGVVWLIRSRREQNA
jgi:fimbrial isopeptide formation D2 family protein